jgi:hypothetical protein
LVARTLAILAVASASAACTKKPPPEQQGPRKPRVDITVVLAPGRDGVDASDVVMVTPAAPPASRQMFERDGMQVAVVAVPPEGELEPLVKTAVLDAEAAGSNATVLLSTRCLRDLQPSLEKNVGAFWTLAVVVGARCEGAVKSNIGAAALIESGGASRVRISFDRHTRAFLKVEPLP